MMYLRLAIATVCLTVCAMGITPEQDSLLADLCLTTIGQDSDFVAGFVRLSFHDCVGGCDGCVDLSLSSNAGLTPYVDALEAAYDSLTFEVSRADFWAKCGATAAEEGKNRSPISRNSNSLQIEMKYGREDCETGEDNPNQPKPDNAANFPNAHHGISDILAWCSTAFSLNDEECVALLGAHTLGRARPQASGYRGPWVPGQDHLDNRYFVDMAEIARWNQINVGGQGDDARWQYDDGRGHMMLNSDMCFAKDIQPDEEGRVTQNLNNIGDSSTASRVVLYATNNNQWLTDFGAVFTKMIDNVDDDLELPSADSVEEITVAPTQAPVGGGGGDGGRDGGGRGGRRPGRREMAEVLHLMAELLETDK